LVGGVASPLEKPLPMRRGATALLRLVRVVNVDRNLYHDAHKTTPHRRKKNVSLTHNVMFFVEGRLACCRCRTDGEVLCTALLLL
jgi:hypothetical protein